MVQEVDQETLDMGTIVILSPQESVIRTSRKSNNKPDPS